jgi:hypothetical protein
MKNDLLDALEVLDLTVRAVAKLGEGMLRESGSCESQSGVALVERARTALDALRAEIIARTERAA